MNYQFERKVYFQDCDPAQIVFYPRYIEMLDDIMEDWLCEIGGWDYLEKSNYPEGLPQISRVQVEFQRPSKLGDTLTFFLKFRKADPWRAWLDVDVLCAQEQRLKVTLELASANKHQPVGMSPLPARLQEILSIETKPV